MAGITTIDLTNFLLLQKMLKFDYLFAINKKDKKGKVMKIPIQEAKDFTEPSSMVCNRVMAKKAILKPSTVPYPLVGFILKKGTGISITDKKIIVIDIDCKKDPVKGKEVFDDVVDYLVDTLKIDRDIILALSEQTVSGGYHIFLTSNNVYPQKKLFIETGIEIEIFSSNRFIAMAPSIGYKPLKSDYNCVDLMHCTDLYMSNIDLDHFCLKFNKEEDIKELDNKIQIKEDFVFDNSAFKKIIRDWTEYENFISGSTNRDWDKISRSSTYDYIRHNIMPVMVLFEKNEEFLKNISQYDDRYYKQWAKYPEKWLELYRNDTIILGSDARKRLNKIGALVKPTKEKNTKQDMIEDFILYHMTALFKFVLVVHGAIYYYDTNFNCYVYLESEVFNLTLGAYYKNKLAKVLKPEDFKTLRDTFDIYSRIFANDSAYDNYLSYDIIRDRTYHSKIPIVFKNGTMYINKDASFTFTKDFDSHDKALYSLQTNFRPEIMKIKEDSIILDWFKTKFDEDALRFIKIFFGNLLVPSYSPSIMLCLYSYKGSMGKSTLAKSLSNIFDIGSNSMITAFPLSSLDDKFGGGSLSKALLNITTELDDRINSEAFKSVISRERWKVEAKFENHRYEIPLAKHVAMSNDIPKISADGGVTRRLAVFPLSEEIARPDLPSHDYEQMFSDDTDSLVGFMLQGLMELIKLNFCDLSNYYLSNYKDNITKVQEFNSNVYEWLGFEGLRFIQEGTKKEGGVPKTSLFVAYKQWCNNEEYSAVKQRTFIKYLLGRDNLKEKRVQKDNGERPRLVTIKA